MHCPGCHGLMAHAAVAGSEVEVCPSCGGVWFDRGELGRLIHREIEAGVALDEENAPPLKPRPKTVRVCPHCHGGMNEYEYAGSSTVVLDHCAACDGTFVEDGELKAIANRLTTPTGAVADRPELLAQVAALTMDLERRIEDARFRKLSAESRGGWWSRRFTPS